MFFSMILVRSPFSGPPFSILVCFFPRGGPKTNAKIRKRLISLHGRFRAALWGRKSHHGVRPKIAPERSTENERARTVRCVFLRRPSWPFSVLVLRAEALGADGSNGENGKALTGAHPFGTLGWKFTGGLSRSQKDNAFERLCDTQRQARPKERRGSIFGAYLCV